MQKERVFDNIWGVRRTRPLDFRESGEPVPVDFMMMKISYSSEKKNKKTASHGIKTLGIAWITVLSLALTGCGAAGASIFMNDGSVVNIGDATPQTPETATEEDAGNGTEGEAPEEGAAGTEEGADAPSGEAADGTDPYITGGDISPFYKPENDTELTSGDPAAADAGTSADSATTQPSSDAGSDPVPNGRGDTTGLGGTAAQIIDNAVTAVGDVIERQNTDIYVATYGSDDIGDGSMDNPYLTVQKALDCVTPGHTIFLMSGIYNGANTLSASGGDGNPITVTAYPGASVTVELGPGQSGAVFDINGHSNININSLRIGYSYSGWVYGVFMSGGENNINISNNEFCNISTTATPGAGGAYAVLCYGTGATDADAIQNVNIYDNRVHDLYTGYSEAIAASGNVNGVKIAGNTVYSVSGIGIDLYGGGGYCPNEEWDHPRNCEISGNTVYQCVSPFTSVAGIYVSGARDCTVSDNYSYENAYGIEIAAENNNFYYPTTNIKVTGNTVHNNHDSGITIGGTNTVTSGYVTNSEVSKNILYNNGMTVNDGANGELHFEKCDTISVKDNIVRNHDYSNAVIGCGMTSEYVKNVTFDNNLYAYDKPEKIVFKFQGNDYIGLDNWNKFTGGKDISSTKSAEEKK